MENENLEKLIELFKKEQEKKNGENHYASLIFRGEIELKAALESHFLTAIKKLDDEIYAATKLRDFFKIFVNEKHKDLDLKIRF